MAKKRLERPRSLGGTTPDHITLRRWRTNPTYLEPFVDQVQLLANDQFGLLESYANRATETLEKAYSQGFEDGYAAAMLETEKHNGKK